MSVEQNLAIVHRYYAECTHDDGDPEKEQALAVVDEIISPDFVMYYNGASDDDALRGRERHKAFLVGHTRAFQGERWTVERIVADEHTVAAQWRIHATHTKTGNPIDLLAADFFTIRDGRLAELRRFIDWQTVDEQTKPKSEQQEGGSTA